MIRLKQESLLCDEILFVYLHESVAVLNKRSVSDPFEGVADVRQGPGLLDQRLVVVDQSQSHTEQDL